MIALADVYHVVAAIVPLYVAMIAAYLSVKWQKLFTPDQCSGINKFVAKFSVPLLSFQVVSTSNPYKMSLKLIFSDAIQKLLAFLMLAIVTKISSRGKFDWIITGLSISTLPNTLILGIPLLRAMYGDEAAALLGQIVVLQSMVWYNLLLFLFELNAIRAISVTPPPSEASGEMATAQGVETKQECENRDAGVAVRNKTVLILSAIGRKLMSNPNTHATILGLIWACIHFRWGLKMPEIVDDSISILAKGGLGMAMFSLGLFMASRGSLISCGTPLIIILTMGMKFLVGPVLMAVPSFSIGLRGTLFRVAIMQAALPQGIVPFVFAREYNVHPDIVSTGVIVGLLIAMPVALGYYFLLAL